MTRPTNCRDELIAKLREKYLSVLSEPIPPNLAALVEKLRAQERAEQDAKKTDD